MTEGRAGEKAIHAAFVTITNIYNAEQFVPFGSWFGTYDVQYHSDTLRVHKLNGDCSKRGHKFNVYGYMTSNLPLVAQDNEENAKISIGIGVRTCFPSSRGNL